MVSSVSIPQSHGVFGVLCPVSWCLKCPVTSLMVVSSVFCPQSHAMSCSQSHGVVSLWCHVLSLMLMSSMCCPQSHGGVLYPVSQWCLVLSLIVVSCPQSRGDGPSIKTSGETKHRCLVCSRRADAKDPTAAEGGCAGDIL